MPKGFQKGHAPFQNIKYFFQKGIHYSPSTEIKKGQHLSKATEFKKGRPNPNKGLKFPERSGKNHPMFGKHHSEETKAQIKKSRKGKCVGEDNHRWKGGKYKINKGYKLISIMEHRLVMEYHIGRKLTKEEEVHHINGIRDDNRIENLILFKNHKEHMQYHKDHPEESSLPVFS